MNFRCSLLGMSSGDENFRDSRVSGFFRRNCFVLEFFFNFILELNFSQWKFLKYLEVSEREIPRTSNYLSQPPQDPISSNHLTIQKHYRQKGLANGEKFPHFIHFNDVHKKSEHASQWPIETISNYLQTHSKLYMWMGTEMEGNLKIIQLFSVVFFFFVLPQFCMATK